jgi:hypothetical protein
VAQLAEAELVALMRQLFDEADGNYGVPRMCGAEGLPPAEPS